MQNMKRGKNTMGWYFQIKIELIAKFQKLFDVSIPAIAHIRND